MAITRFMFAYAAIVCVTQIALASGPADFNGDGYADLAIGVPGETLNGKVGSGVVHVLYGSAQRLKVVVSSELWHQDLPGIADKSETGDRFGSALAWGDFNGDFFDDLAISIPGENVNGRTDAGAVCIIYGSADGLTANGSQLWHQDKPNIVDQSDAFDNFGYAMVAGDFNGDGLGDLAIGVPGESFSGRTKAGIVHVLYGTPAGLSAANSERWNQNAIGLEESPENMDQFGFTMAAGDIDNDGADDLAIGVPFEDKDGKINVGIVHVIYGSVTGLSAANAHLLRQDDGSQLEQPGPHDQFGSALSIGDYNGDGYADLAIGVIGEDVGTIQDAGAVQVYYGADGGIGDGTEQVWTQNTPGIADQAEAGDYFGASLASGDFNGDGFADLAIGVPRENRAGVDDAGALHVIFGSGTGLVAAGDALLHQNSAGVPLDPIQRGQYAATLAAGDFDGDGFADLAVGAPFEPVHGNVAAGLLDVAYCRTGNILTAVHKLWHQNRPLVSDDSEANDLFAGSLGAGLYNVQGLLP